jgi:hypothetical protein
VYKGCERFADGGKMSQYMDSLKVRAKGGKKEPEHKDPKLAAPQKRVPIIEAQAAGGKFS